METSCNRCGTDFCSINRLRQHERTEHVGDGTNQPPTPNTNLDTPIFPDTGYSQTSEYNNTVDEHYNVIRSQTVNRSSYKIVNKQISPDYTYNDVKRLLDNIMRKESGTFKINLGFGFMLYDIISKVYRYFYVSTNHYLFDRAFTISTGQDMTNFFNKIFELDLANEYYMKRPSSG